MGSLSACLKTMISSLCSRLTCRARLESKCLASFKTHLATEFRNFGLDVPAEKIKARDEFRGLGVTV